MAVIRKNDFTSVTMKDLDYVKEHYIGLTVTIVNRSYGIETKGILRGYDSSPSTATFIFSDNYKMTAPKDSFRTGGTLDCIVEVPILVIPQTKGLLIYIHEVCTEDELPWPVETPFYYHGHPEYEPEHEEYEFWRSVDGEHDVDHHTITAFETVELVPPTKE